MANFDPVFLSSYNSAVNCVPTIDGGLADVEEDPEMSCHDDFLVDFSAHTHTSGFMPGLSNQINQGVTITFEDAEKMKEWMNSHTFDPLNPPPVPDFKLTFNPEPTGWVCPRCKICLAPTMPSCMRCAPAYAPLTPTIPAPVYPYEPVPTIEPFPFTPYPPVTWGGSWTSDTISVTDSSSLGAGALKGAGVLKTR